MITQDGSLSSRPVHLLHRPKWRHGKNHLSTQYLPALADVFNFFDSPTVAILLWILALWEVGPTPEALVALFMGEGARKDLANCLRDLFQVCTQKINHKAGPPRGRCIGDRSTWCRPSSYWEMHGTQAHR